MYAGPEDLLVQLNATCCVVSHLDPQCDLHELLQLHHQLRQAATIIACLGHIIVKALQYRIQGCKVLLSLRQTLNVI